MEGCSRILQLKTPRSWVLWVYPLKESFGVPEDPSIFLEFCQIVFPCRALVALPGFQTIQWLIVCVISAVLGVYRVVGRLTVILTLPTIKDVSLPLHITSSTSAFS